MNTVVLLLVVLFGAHAFPERDHLTVEVKEPIIENVDYEELRESNNNNVGGIKQLAQDEEESIQAKVSYSGSQLWKVRTDDDNDKKKILASLRDNQG